MRSVGISGGLGGSVWMFGWSVVSVWICMVCMGLCGSVVGMCGCVGSQCGYENGLCGSVMICKKWICGWSVWMCG